MYLGFPVGVLACRYCTKLRRYDCLDPVIIQLVGHAACLMCVAAAAAGVLSADVESHFLQTLYIALVGMRGAARIPPGIHP